MQYLAFLLLIPLAVNAAQVKPCGGFAGFTCPNRYTCIDDSRDDCDPKAGGADCIGICVRNPKHPQPCGSRGLKPCHKGELCIDPDPHDTCTPEADCPGICVKRGKATIG